MKEVKHKTAQIFNIRNQNDRLLTKAEIAEVLSVSIKAIDKWVCAKDIPFIKLGRLVRFRRGEIEKWLDLKQRNH